MSDETPDSSTEAGLTITDEDAAKLLADPDDADTADQSTKSSTFTQDDVDRIVNERLSRERKKYADYGDLKREAAKAKTVEQQLEELRSQLSERDQRELERNGRLAMAQLNTRLAEAGIKSDDVSGLLKRIQGSDLLTDGEPDEKAVAELADSLVKIAGRATPDPDQGQKGGRAPADMNQLIRRAAGIQ